MVHHLMVYDDFGFDQNFDFIALYPHLNVSTCLLRRLRHHGSCGHIQHLDLLHHRHGLHPRRGVLGSYDRRRILPLAVLLVGQHRHAHGLRLSYIPVALAYYFQSESAVEAEIDHVLRFRTRILVSVQAELDCYLRKREREREREQHTDAVHIF